jgi:acyl dehydratase
MSYTIKGLHYGDFEPGRTFHTARRTLTEADVTAFAGISGDFNPLHTDAVFMAEHPLGKRIAHGMLSMSIATGLANQLGIFEGTTIALLEMHIKFTGPVFFQDTVQLEITVKERKESAKPDRGIVIFDCTLRNQEGGVVLQSEWTCLMRR